MRKKFSPLVPTGPEAHPASYTKDTGTFLGVKRPERGVDHPTPPIAKVKERVELYLYSRSGLSLPVLELTLTLLLPEKQFFRFCAYEAGIYKPV
jgi:hypothetical protein